MLAANGIRYYDINTSSSEICRKAHAPMIVAASCKLNAQPRVNLSACYMSGMGIIVSPYLLWWLDSIKRKQDQPLGSIKYFHQTLEIFCQPTVTNTLFIHFLAILSLAVQAKRHKLVCPHWLKDHLAVQVNCLSVKPCSTVGCLKFVLQNKSRLFLL